MCEGKWNTGLIPVISLLDTYFSVGFLQYSGKTILLSFWCGFFCLFICWFVFLFGFGIFVGLVWFFYLIFFTVSVVNEDRKMKLNIDFLGQLKWEHF